MKILYKKTLREEIEEAYKEQYNDGVMIDYIEVTDKEYDQIRRQYNSVLPKSIPNMEPTILGIPLKVKDN